MYTCLGTPRWLDHARHLVEGQTDVAHKCSKNLDNQRVDRHTRLGVAISFAPMHAPRIQFMVLTSKNKNQWFAAFGGWKPGRVTQLSIIAITLHLQEIIQEHFYRRALQQRLHALREMA